MHLPYSFDHVLPDHVIENPDQIRADSIDARSDQLAQSESGKDDIQLQIFQRSFSTKGLTRGLGTYSVKLLTENYLKGKVSFMSNALEGTVFSVELKKKFPADLVD